MLDVLFAGTEDMLTDATMAHLFATEAIGSFLLRRSITEEMQTLRLEQG
jgi:hypothetical protein